MNTPTTIQTPAARAARTRRIYTFRPVILLLLVALLTTACVGSGHRSSSTNSQVRKSADNALVHAQLARGYLQQKQYAVAKAELEEALRIDSNHSDSNYVMALLMMELEQYETAEKHFYRAVRADQENAAAAHDFGMFLCQFGKERESVKYFEIAAGNPLFENAELSHMRAGECLAQINDPAAEQYLKRALAANPNLRPALFRMAKLKHDERSYFLARAYIERYFAITNPQPAALLLA
ncbi:MAG: hypothetical protein HKN85_09370, partial [Gammaproteobacteria bacterium]|nr:hypothetical protein [Gammaproteobacteria bacterium]